MATTTRTRSATKAKGKTAAATDAAAVERKDVYTRITETIVAQLEAGTRPWHQPWSSGHAAGPISRPLRHDGTPCRGVNVLMLWIAAMERGYAAPLWMTYRQALKLGGHVRKGETSTLVAYADRFRWTKTDDEGDEQTLERWFWKGYLVFNVEQIDGLPAHYYAPAETESLAESERVARVERFVEHTGAVVETSGSLAAYRLDKDVVLMPPFPSFANAESYYATLLHELTHWTRHPSRLARDLGRKKWGDAGYAMEELVAEMAAAFLSADLAVSPVVRDDHAGYIAGWLQVLKHDNRAVFTAAAHAQRAADFLWKLQPATTEPTAEDEHDQLV